MEVTSWLFPGSWCHPSNAPVVDLDNYHCYSGTCTHFTSISTHAQAKTLPAPWHHFAPHSLRSLRFHCNSTLRWHWKSTDRLRYDVARVNDFLRLESATSDHFFKADIKSFFECQRVCDLEAINLSHWGRRKLGSKMCWESSLFFSLFLMRGLSGRRKIEKADENGYRF